MITYIMDIIDTDIIPETRKPKEIERESYDDDFDDDDNEDDYSCYR